MVRAPEIELQDVFSHRFGTHRQRPNPRLVTLRSPFWRGEAPAAAISNALSIRPWLRRWQRRHSARRPRVICSNATS